MFISALNNVVAAIYEKYDMEKVERVYIHADGGNWIRTLGALMPEAVFVMDGFHLEKYFKKLFRLNAAAPYSGIVRKAVRENNFEAFAGYISSIREKMPMSHHSRPIMSRQPTWRCRWAVTALS